MNEPVAPPRGPWRGWAYVPRPAKDWRVLPADANKRCRFAGGVGHRHCPEDAVAEFNRKRIDGRTGRRLDAWWAYCTAHVQAYHRWVVGDRVLEWHLVAREENA